MKKTVASIAAATVGFSLLLAPSALADDDDRKIPAITLPDIDREKLEKEVKDRVDVEELADKADDLKDKAKSQGKKLYKDFREEWKKALDTYSLYQYDAMVEVIGEDRAYAIQESGKSLRKATRDGDVTKKEAKAIRAEMRSERKSDRMKAIQRVAISWYNEGKITLEQYEAIKSRYPKAFPEVSEEGIDVKGLTSDEAVMKLGEAGIPVRIVQIDGESLPVTMDIQPDRANLTITDGVVTDCYYG
jgi:predicted HTH domain antitoxin